MFRTTLIMVLSTLCFAACPSGDEDGDDECAEKWPQTISPAVIEFGQVAFGATAKRTITVCGIDAFKDTAPYLGPDDEPWALVGPHCTSSGTKCEWVLSYHPIICPVRDNLSLIIYDANGMEIRTAEDVYAEGTCD